MQMLVFEACERSTRRRCSPAQRCCHTLRLCLRPSKPGKDLAKASWGMAREREAAVTCQTTGNPFTECASDGTLMRPMGAESLASECLRGGWGAEAQFRERRAHESALQEDEAAAAWDSNCHCVVVLGACDACSTPYLQAKRVRLSRTRRESCLLLHQRIRSPLKRRDLIQKHSGRPSRRERWHNQV
jgi:hypothetical protein